jgi:hypothetical protein
MPSPASAPTITDSDFGPQLRVDVHDRSRLEWVATVPLAPPGEAQTWEIALETEIPDAMFVPHHPWDHFTVRSRLMSPRLLPGHRMVGPAIDQLRRRALAAAHDLKVAQHGLNAVVVRARRRDGVLRDDEVDELERRLRAWTARGQFDYLNDHKDLSLAKEQLLASAYVSLQLLLVVTKLAAALEGGRKSAATALRRARRARQPLRGEIARVQKALTEVLQQETQQRKAIGVVRPEVKTPRDVAHYVNRAALLKKHFQQALFLDARAYMLDQRARNWIAVVMAMVASTFYFVWQIYVLNAAMSPGATTVSLMMAAVIAALVYAAKDRIKEVGRDWLQSRLKHSYADRVAHLSLQERMDPDKHDFGLARETITLKPGRQIDQLNPGLGRTQLVHHLRISELLRHNGLEVLHDQGLLGLKHVFRYDLSPLFVKLDDCLKQVAVMGRAGVQTVTATRVYAMPVTVTMQRVNGRAQPMIVQHGTLLVQRRGLVRFQPADTSTAADGIGAANGKVPAEPVRASHA